MRWNHKDIENLSRLISNNSQKKYKGLPKKKLQDPLVSLLNSIKHRKFPSYCKKVGEFCQIYSTRPASPYYQNNHPPTHKLKSILLNIHEKILSKCYQTKSTAC
jgi:hypothetical protein